MTLVGDGTTATAPVMSRITVQRLESGWYHVRGAGPCNWSQPPHWPATEAELREHAHPEAGEAFFAVAVAAAAMVQP